jgi:hypothetical protein
VNTQTQDTGKQTLTHRNRKKTYRSKPLSLIIAWTLLISWLAPYQSAEADDKSAIALEKLADEQFAAHDIDCIENYRDTIFAWSRDGKFSDRLRAIEKLCKALTYGREKNSFMAHCPTEEIAEDVTAIGGVPTEEIPGLVAALNCSDGFTDCSPEHQFNSWLALLRMISHATFIDTDSQKACLEKLVPVMDPGVNAPVLLSALKVLQDAPEKNRSVTQDLSNKLESSIANISEESPEFSVLTADQVEVYRHCKTSTLERTSQDKQLPSPEGMIAMIVQQPFAEREKILQLLIKQEPSYESEDTEHELALGWSCDLCGAHHQASKYYLCALQRLKHIRLTSPMPMPNLTSNECLAQLSLVGSYIEANQLKEAQSNLEEVRPVLAALPEIHAHGFRELLLPFEGELAWKSGRLLEAESLLTQASNKFNSLPRQNELSMFFRGRPELKNLLPGEEKTLNSLIEVLKLEKKYAEAEKRQTELKSLRTGVRNSDSMDKFQSLPYFPGCRGAAYAKQLAPAYVKRTNDVYSSDDEKLLTLDGLAQKSIEQSLFETARIFVDDALFQVGNKNDERSQSFKALFLVKKIRIDVETGKFENASAEIDAFTKLIKPTAKDAQLETLDVKGWLARMLLYEHKFSEAQAILESILPVWRQVQQNSELSGHQRNHVLDLARVYLAQKKNDLAESTLVSYLKDLGSGPNEPQFIWVQALLASRYAEKGHTGLANTVISESVDQLTALAPHSVDIDETYAIFAIADFYKTRGNVIRAERYNSKANNMLNYLGLEKH